MPRDVDVTTVTTPSELLNAAADVLDRDGWCQGEFEEKRTTRVCALGAMMRVMGMGGRFFGDFASHPVAQQAVKRLCHQVRLPVIYLPLLSAVHAEGSALAEWNNAPERTADEVKAAMRTAANHLTARPGCMINSD